MEKQKKAPAIPDLLKFIFGGCSGMMATAVVQPLDLVKNRMQLAQASAETAPRSTFSIIKNILKQEGVLGFYNGLSAGLLRQATYTTTRLGTYTFLSDRLTRDGVPPSFVVKAAMGIGAGAVGAMVGTPAEISLIRMTADGQHPPHLRRNYKNVFDAIFRIVREEGLFTLWRGCTPTVLRAMVVNATQLATYSQVKQKLLETKMMRDDLFCDFCSSMISGLATTITSMPVDIAKTRIQNMKTVDGRPEYKNALDVWLKIARNEGPQALWKGFTPYYFRIAPHTVLMFIFLEQINRAYLSYKRDGSSL
ncbi:Mitochondrial 2-oxoglutarate/malate carrier protein [Trichinella patagoniensis]|uniref:Mitochondrial 2-oxoglutarate/malate carrier protein n=1 Tax=Trichinella patagoniensis TaxID=990121 RepID=A0A0V0ZQN6_9BILA|nr:Mitochondrial 2-oxoglutarate/malate carrier protein [Trichinella patagoniensis]